MTLCLLAAVPVQAAGGASAVAAQASLTGTVLGLPVSLLDVRLADVEVSQGDPDATSTETVLSIDLPVLGSVPLVTAAVVSSTASSDTARAEAVSLLTDVAVNLPVGGLPTVLELDTIQSSSTCPIFGEPSYAVEPPVALSLLGVEVDVELDTDIVVDIGIATATVRIGAGEATEDAASATGLSLNLDVSVLGVVEVNLGLKLADTACDRGEAVAEAFVPDALEVDYAVVISDGNGVLEPGERADVAPAWRNITTALTVGLGEASNIQGPAGGNYELTATDADYGQVGPGAAASCRVSDLCYQVDIGPGGGERPARHWDATFDEELADGSAYTWTLHIGDSFEDTPRTHPFYKPIEGMWHNAITAGCTTTTFCPGAPNTRAQMTAFVLKGAEGPDYAPPACVPGSEMFADVPAHNNYCASIEEAARRGITGGCGGNNFCPTASMTRAAMSIFLLRAAEGPGYLPPACEGLFTDVPCPSTFADWIEELFRRGITSGCGSPTGGYCPNAVVNRAQMSQFVGLMFDLRLYGP